MKSMYGKVAIIAVLFVAIVGVVQLKQRHGAATLPQVTATQDAQASTPSPPVTAVSPAPPPTKTTPAPKIANSGTVKESANTAKTTAVAGKATPPPAPTPNAPVKTEPALVKAAPVKKATFIELGADKCVPCKMMQPIMDELRQEYPDTLNVVFHDVWKDPSIGDKYGVHAIPTQVLLDGEGKEIFRHIGFWPKDELIAKFTELGINL